MRFIIIIFVLMPYFSWSMDDTAFSSVCSDDMVDEEAYQSVEGNNQNDNPDQLVITSSSPRSIRSNSYVQTFHDVLRRSREMRVDGLAELEEGVGVVGTPCRVLTEDQIAAYFFTSMEGQNLPGVGVFDREDKDQCDYLHGLIGVIKRVDPKRYDGMVRSITHHRSRRYPNTALVEVMSKIVDSIDSLNQQSNNIGKSQYAAAMLQLKIMEERLKVEQDSLTLARISNNNTTRRYRIGIIWTVLGGGLAVAVTNLLQHYLLASDMTQMCQQMQNTTMS